MAKITHMDDAGYTMLNAFFMQTNTPITWPNDIDHAFVTSFFPAAPPPHITHLTTVVAARSER